MRISKIALFISIVSLSASASNLADLDPNLAIKLDPGLSKQEVKALRADIKAIRNLNLELRADSTFDRIFKGTSSQAILDYLGERVHYILSPNYSPDQSGRTIPAAATADAVNIGTQAWYNVVASGLTVNLPLGKSLMPVSSARSGIILLGRKFITDPAFFSNSVSTLVHEARHSDCTGGIKRADAVAFLTQAISPSFNYICGHLHSKCPEGHEFAGRNACDNHPWGSYSIELVYNAALIQNCTNCDEVTKQIAIATFNDSLTRLQFDVKDMIQGKLGLPDMSDDPTISD